MTKKYRKNVGVIVFKNHKVLLFSRADQKTECWQFPQGGIEKNETIINAAKRELFEETCIKNIRFCLSIQGKAVPLQADYYQ